MSALPTSSRRSRDISHEDLVCLEDLPEKPLKEGMQILIDYGRIGGNGNPPSSPDYSRMIRETGYALEKYYTDYNVLDKSPVSTRPFYAMPDPNDPAYTSLFNFLLPVRDSDRLLAIFHTLIRDTATNIHNA